MSEAVVGLSKQQEYDRNGIIVEPSGMPGITSGSTHAGVPGKLTEQQIDQRRLTQPVIPGHPNVLRHSVIVGANESVRIPVGSLPDIIVPIDGQKYATLQGVVAQVLFYTPQTEIAVQRAELSVETVMEDLHAEPPNLAPTRPLGLANGLLANGDRNPLASLAILDSLQSKAGIGGTSPQEYGETVGEVFADISNRAVLVGDRESMLKRSTQDVTAVVSPENDDIDIFAITLGEDRTSVEVMELSQSNVRELHMLSKILIGWCTFEGDKNVVISGSNVFTENTDAPHTPCLDVNTMAELDFPVTYDPETLEGIKEEVTRALQAYSKPEYVLVEGAMPGKILGLESVSMPLPAEAKRSVSSNDSLDTFAGSNPQGGGGLNVIELDDKRPRRTLRRR